MPTQMDYVRLAAYIDAEGSIILTTMKKGYKPGRNTTYCLNVVVCNTDRRMVDWCANVFGGWVDNHTRTKTNVNVNHVLYTWHAPANKYDLLRKCLPYFVIKAEQALVALAYRRTFANTKRGTTLTEEVLQLREACRLFMKELKHTKRGYFEWGLPKEIEHLFYWLPEEIPDVRNFAN